MNVSDYLHKDYLDFLDEIHLPYWYGKNGLNKIYHNEYLTIIQYKDIIKDLINNNNYASVRYINKDENNDLIYTSDLSFVDSIQILLNNQYVNLTTFFNTNNIFSTLY